MNWDQIEGNWKQLKGNVQQQWAKLTDDDLSMVDGKREELAGKIQEAYGVNKSDAEKQVDDWQSKQTDLDYADSDHSDDSLDSNRNTAPINKFDYDANEGGNTNNDNLGNTPRRMQDGMGDDSGSTGPGDGAGIPGEGEFDEMDDTGNPNPNPMPDDMDEPPHAQVKETPHEEKSIDQT